MNQDVPTTPIISFPESGAAPDNTQLSDQDRRVQLFRHLLTSTKRDGMPQFLDYLDRTSFYTDPASVKHHMNIRGGLLRHSLNTYYAAMNIWNFLKHYNPQCAKQVTHTNIIIASLLHDVGKTGTYQENPDVPSPDPNGKKRKPKQPYTLRPNITLPMPHEERSIYIIMENGLHLEPAELLAIRYHMSAWSKSTNAPEHLNSLTEARAQNILVTIISIADETSSQLMERWY